MGYEVDLGSVIGPKGDTGPAGATDSIEFNELTFDQIDENTGLPNILGEHGKFYVYKGIDNASMLFVYVDDWYELGGGAGSTLDLNGWVDLFNEAIDVGLIRLTHFNILPSEAVEAWLAGEEYNPDSSDTEELN